MARVLFRTLLSEPSRTVLSILAVAAAITLVLVFEGFRVGLYQQVRAFPEGLPTELVVTQAGVSNVLGARSILPRDTRSEVEAVAGVKTAHPLGGMPIIYSAGGQSTPVYVVAYDTAGGPRRLAAGREISETSEIVVDTALAKKYGIAADDAVEFLGHRFTVAGLSEGTTNFFDPYVFVRLDDLVDLYMAGDLPGDLPMDAVLSFLLVEVDAGTDVGTVRAAIEQTVDAVDVFTPAELAENDVRRIRAMLGPALNLLVVIAYVVGVLIVGLTLYVSVASRVREFAVMKAVGAYGWWLAREVIGEAFVISLLALGTGIGLACGLAFVIHWAMPAYQVEPLDGSVLIRTGVAVTVMAAVGVLLPLRRILAVDPALVFTR